MENTNYSEELQRILNSSLPTQVLKQLTKSQIQITSIQDTIINKNTQISTLHERLKQQIDTINQLIAVNDKLTQQNQTIKKSFKTLKEQLNDFKGTCISMLQGYLIKQKQNTLKKVNQSIQTFAEHIQNSTSPNGLNEAIINQNFIQTVEMAVQTDQNTYFQSFKQHQNRQLKMSAMTSYIYRGQKQSDMKTSIQCQTEHDIQNQNNQKNQKQILLIIQSLQSQIKSLRVQKEQISEQVKFLREQMSKHMRCSHKQDSQKSKLVEQKNSQIQQNYWSAFSSQVSQQNYQLQLEDQSIKIMKVLANIQTLKEKKFIGQIMDNNKTGMAICQFENHWHYEGNYRMGKMHGLGTLFYQNQKIYYGNWKNQQIEGVGVLYYSNSPDILEISGMFKKGVIEGYGTIKFRAGYQIKCKFVDGVAQIQSDNCLLTFDRNLLQSQFGSISESSKYMQSESLQKDGRQQTLYGKIGQNKLGRIFQTNLGRVVELY